MGVARDAGMLTRRSFLAASAGSLALASCRDLIERSGSPRSVLPAPQRGGIRHVVVVMMENRSFDHFLGWLPGADGMQAGLVYDNAAGIAHSTHTLAPDYQGCRFRNPDHSYRAAASSTTAGPATGGCSSTTTSRSATTSKPTWRSSGARLRTGRYAIATSRRSWRRPTRTGSTSMPASPIASTTRSR